MTLFILPDKHEWAIEQELHFRLGEHLVLPGRNEVWAIRVKAHQYGGKPVYFIEEECQ